MNASILNGIISNLAATRPCFFSEADFQHSLGCALKCAGYKVYLEYPINGDHIDIIVEDNGAYYPIELKYKTKAMSCVGLFGNVCTTSNQKACNIGRFQFWGDVKRVENLVTSLNKCGVHEGYVVMLTNDPAYWTAPIVKNSNNTIDHYFKIHSGMRVQNVHWDNKPPRNINNPNYVTKNGTYYGFSLLKPYIVPEWINYSNPNNCPFNFLTIAV